MTVELVLLKYVNINMLLNVAETLLLITLVAFNIWDRLRK